MNTPIHEPADSYTELSAAIRRIEWLEAANARWVAWERALRIAAGFQLWDELTLRAQRSFAGTGPVGDPITQVEDDLSRRVGEHMIRTAFDG